MNHTETDKRSDHLYFYLIDKHGRKQFRHGHVDEALHMITMYLEENNNKGGQGVYMYDSATKKWVKLCYYNTL